MAVSGDGQTLYAGGSFTSIGGVAVTNVARFDGQAWSSMADGLNGAVWALAMVDLGAGPTLVAGGEFTASGGTQIAHLARWDGDSWQAVGSGTDGSVFALAAYPSGGNSLTVAGQFTTAGGVTAKNIAQYNGNTWAALGGGLSGTPISFVRALAVYDAGSGPELYAAGRFTSPSQNIARWSGGNWQTLGSGAYGTVNTLAVWNDGTGAALYAGGAFVSAGGLVDATRVARWNGSAWSALQQGVRDDEVNSLAVFNDGTGEALFAAGRFTIASGVAARRITKWSGSGWSTLGSGLPDDTSEPCWCEDPECDCGPSPAVVYAVAVFRDSLYVAGEFTQADCISPINLARWASLPSDTVVADLDWSGRVDMADLDVFISCATGPALGPVVSCCEPADLDYDGHIDLVDFAIIQRCLTITPGSLPEPGCD
jgi:hypothetical protein